MASKDLIIEPWLLELNEREQVFYDAKKNNKKIALYYVKAPDSSTFRYRCFNTFQITQNSKKWQAVFFFRDEVKEIKKLIPECDLFIFGRQSRWDSLVKELSTIAKENKKKVLFDLDDLVFDKKYLHVVANTIGEMDNLDYWLPYFADINKTATNMDGFIVTNDYLGERISGDFKKPYKVIRNSLNDEQMSASNSYLRFKQSPSNTEGFKIGYFSGSPTHVNDLEVALPEILKFLQDHPDAILEVVGLMEFDKRAKRFLDNGQIVFLPPVDFRKLQRLVSEVDVNIAPLVINEFTNCKSELKFFEAGVVETTTIASPTYTFERAITDGENGFLAYPGEWYEKLEFLYKHPEENKKIAKNARNYSLRHYYGKEFLKEVEEAYEYFAK